MKRHLFFTLLSLSCLFGGFRPALAQEAEPITPTLLWKVTDNGLEEPSYIFGTYHLMDSSFVQKYPVIRRKLMACQQVYGELDMSDPALMSEMATAGIMKDSTLQDLLTEEEYEQVGKVLKEETGMGIQLFNKMKPVLVTQTITLQVLSKELGRSLASPTASLDGYLQALAKRHDKTTGGLEDIQDQIDALFNSASLQEQADALVEAIQQMDKLRREALTLDSCYMEMNLQCLVDLIPEADMTENQMEDLLDNRNRNWVGKMPKIMDEGPTFFAVGALHLPGREGLIKLLRQEGYTVEPITEFE